MEGNEGVLQKLQGQVEAEQKRREEVEKENGVIRGVLRALVEENLRLKNAGVVGGGGAEVAREEEGEGKVDVTVADASVNF
ncbi:hypothetical protein HK097_008266, partial [Rhizophlyctis rosea]